MSLTLLFIICRQTIILQTELHLLIYTIIYLSKLINVLVGDLLIKHKSKIISINLGTLEKLKN